MNMKANPLRHEAAHARGRSFMTSRGSRLASFALGVLAFAIGCSGSSTSGGGNGNGDGGAGNGGTNGNAANENSPTNSSSCALQPGSYRVGYTPTTGCSQFNVDTIDQKPGKNALADLQSGTCILTEDGCVHTQVCKIFTQVQTSAQTTTHIWKVTIDPVSSTGKSSASGTLDITLTKQPDNAVTGNCKYDIAITPTPTK